MSKGIIIGLGGAGVTMAGHLKKILKDNTSPEEFNTSYRFLFMDTAQDRVTQINERYGKTVIDANSGTEFIDLGSTNPGSFTMRARQNPNDPLNKKFLEWIDPLVSNGFNARTLLNGASGYRMEGRVAIAAFSNAIRNKIANHVGWLATLSQEIQTRLQSEGLQGQNLTNEQKIQEPKIWILSGTTGGTGSASLIDVLYLVFCTYHEKGARGVDPGVRVVLSMPQVYLDAQTSNEERKAEYRSNAYAVFKEIDSLVKYKLQAAPNNKEIFHHFQCGTGQSTEKPWSVLEYCLPVDSNLSNQGRFTQEELYQNVANLIYYMSLGPAQQTVDAHLVNTMQGIINATAESKWTKYILGSGYMALTSGKGYFEDYFKARLKNELFQYGLLGNRFDEIEPDEDKRDKQIHAIKGETIDTFLKFVSQKEVTQDDTALGNIEARCKMLSKSYRNKINIDSSGLKNDKGKYTTDTVTYETIDAYVKTSVKQVGEFRAAVEKNKENWKERALSFIQMKAMEFVERSIIKYGLYYAKDIITQLDVWCEQERTAMQLELKKIKEEGIGGSYKGKSVEAIIKEVSDGIIYKSLGMTRINGDKLDELGAIMAKYYDLNYREQLLELHQDILRMLSEGESGWLDKLEQNVTTLSNKIHTRWNDKLYNEYRTELPKVFIDTQKTVTEIILPRVHTFVENGTWKDNAFSNVFQGYFTRKGDSTVPLRYTAKGSSKQTLETVITDILCNKEINGAKNYFTDENNQTKETSDFFISYIEPGSNGVFNQDSLVDKLMKFSDVYIKQVAFRDKNVSEYLSKNIRDRFNDLSTKERGVVTGLFGDNQINLFCNVDTTQAKAYNYWYFGHDDELAKKSFGYDGGSDKKFVTVNGMSDKLLKLKIVEGLNFGDYRPINDLERSYNDMLKVSYFNPHIHKKFKENPNLLNLFKSTADQNAGLSINSGYNHVDAVSGLLYACFLLNVLTDTERKDLYQIKAANPSKDEFKVFEAIVLKRKTLQLWIPETELITTVKGKTQKIVFDNNVTKEEIFNDDITELYTIESSSAFKGKLDTINKNIKTITGVILKLKGAESKKKKSFAEYEKFLGTFKKDDYIKQLDNYFQNTIKEGKN